MDEKKRIRKEISVRRKAAADAEILENSRKIFRQVTGLPEYRAASSVFAYMDYNHEVMTREFIETAWKDGKRVAVPKVSGKEMIFYILEDFRQLETGYCGIPEPSSGIEAADPEALILVPGVAFDTMRHRIGYGGGFYDRYLSSHPGHPTAAVAFEFQIFPEVPTEPADVRPDILVTEKRIFR